jgi:hypothetical protein
MNGNLPGSIPSCPAPGANGTHNFPALPAALNAYTTILCQKCGGTLGLQLGQPPQFTPNSGSSH